MNACRTLSLGAAVAVLLVLASGCASPPPASRAPAVLDALWPAGRETVPLGELATRAPLEAGEDFRAVELARDDVTSHHVVSIRNAEVPHRHDRHDLIVVLLTGYGTMQLADEIRALGTGSILYVPRGTLHAFDNHSDAPAVAYAIYLPAFDGTDRVVGDGDPRALPPIPARR